MTHKNSSGEAGKDPATVPTENLAAQGDGQSGLVGSELDAAVAERVMGWQRQPDYNYWMTFSDGGTFKLHKLMANWLPSTDIAAAMEVVEKVGDVIMVKRGDQWHVEFQLNYVPTANARSTSLPEAISRAALAAVAHNEEK